MALVGIPRATRRRTSRLAWRERIGSRRLGVCQPGIVGDHMGRDRRAEVSFAPGHCPHRRLELGSPGLLEQVAGGAIGQSPSGVGLFPVHRQDQDLGFRVFAPTRPASSRPSSPGMVMSVTRTSGRWAATRASASFPSLASATISSPAASSSSAQDTDAEESVVVGQYHPDRIHKTSPRLALTRIAHGAAGRVRRTRVPPPGFDSISACPPGSMALAQAQQSKGGASTGSFGCHGDVKAHSVVIDDQLEARGDMMQDGTEFGWRRRA